MTQTVHTRTCHITEQRGWKVTKLDEYFISKYDFGIPSLLSDKPLGRSRELDMSWFRSSGALGLLLLQVEAEDGVVWVPSGGSLP